MNLKNLREQQTRSLEFVILSLVWFVCIGLIFKHYMTLPKVHSTEIIERIDEKEQVLKEQEQITKQVEELFLRIRSNKFERNQTHVENEIQREIQAVGKIFGERNGDSKYTFCAQSSQVLQMLFDTRDRLYSNKRSFDDIKKNLEECQAGILSSL